MDSVHNQVSVDVKMVGQVVFVIFLFAHMAVMVFAVFLESVNVKLDGRENYVMYALFILDVQMEFAQNPGSVTVLKAGLGNPVKHQPGHRDIGAEFVYH